MEDPQSWNTFFLKRILIPSLSNIALPTAINANIDLKIAEFY